MPKSFRKFALAAARAAVEKKAEEVKIFDLRRQSGLADYLLVATVFSPAQMDAVEELIQQELGHQGLSRLRHEGSHSQLWRVLDYGGVLIHLMHEQAREFYGLDRLFADSKKVAWKASRRNSG